MENAKKHREISKKESSIRQFIVIFIACTLTSIVILYLEAGTFNKYSDASIKMYKEEAYDIYNYGLKEKKLGGYRNIKIQTPKKEDMDSVFNKGLKYVVHKDLLNIEIDESYYKINYQDGVFYFYDNSKLMSIKIIIDPENSDDISCYTYDEQIKIKSVLVRMIFVYIVLLLYYGLMFLIKNQSKENNEQKEENNTEQQNEYPKNEDVKKKKNKKKNK